jgi:predicted transcriptional regulator
MRRRCCVGRTFILEELPRLTAAEVRTLFVILLHHSIERGAFPGAKTISGLAQLERQTVHACIKSLQEKGLLERQTLNGKPLYWLRVDSRNVLLGDLETCHRNVTVSPTDDRVSPTEDKVSPTEDRVSPVADTDCQREKTISSTPRAGARTHVPLNNDRSNLRKGPLDPNGSGPSPGSSTESLGGKKKHLGSWGSKEVVDPVDVELVEVERRRRLAEELIKGGDKA